MLPKAKIEAGQIIKQDCANTYFRLLIRCIYGALPAKATQSP